MPFAEVSLREKNQWGGMEKLRLSRLICCAGPYDFTTPSFGLT